MLKILSIFLILHGLLNINSFAQTVRNVDSNQSDQSDSSKQKEVFQMEKPFKNCLSVKNKYQTENGIASDNESAYVPLSNGKLISISKNIKATEWATDLGGEIIQEPYLFGNYLAVLTKIKDNAEKTENSPNIENSETNYFLRLLNKNNGLVRWQMLLPLNRSRQTDVNVSFYSFEPNRLIAMDTEGNSYLLDTADGRVIAKKNFHIELSTKPIFDEQIILFGTANKEIVRLLAETLEITERIEVAAIPRIVFSFENHIVWGDDKGQLFFLESIRYKKEYQEKEKGKENSAAGSFNQKWTLRIGGKVSAIASFEKNLLVTSLDNYVYLVSSKNGEVIWKHRLPNRPIFKPLIVEEYAVILTVGDSTALVLELKSGKTVNKIDISDGNFFTGNPGKFFHFLFFPTARGIFLYTSAVNCP